MNRTIGAISSENIRAERNRLKLTADDVAERYNDPGMSATVLRNIESGRRRNPATVEEWLRLAHALGVPPETLLLPDNVTQVDIAPGVAVGRNLLLQWIRGQQPLPGTDERHYHQIASLTLPTDAGRGRDAKDELLRRVGSLLDTVDEVTDEISRATRGQVYSLLNDIQELLTSGASPQTVVEKIEGIKDRLAELI